MLGTQIAHAFLSAAKDHKTQEDWALIKEKAYIKNKWFEEVFVNQNLDQWIEALQPKAVETWLQAYPEFAMQEKELGIIMAGNIPMVGFHDLICGLAAGWKVRVKLSSDDEVLIKFWVEKASQIMPELADRILFSDQFKGLDAAIATGSNNSAHYFEYYFKNIPHLLRKNRNSVAVLTGSESPEILTALGHDAFDYFGLGCRNITHLFLPKDYAFKPLFDAWETFNWIYNHNKYVNNYHYHKALLLMNLDPHLDTGFLLVKERMELYSPVGMLNYSFYENPDEVSRIIASKLDEIQCVVSTHPQVSGLKPGDTQKVHLGDYADGKDVMAWFSSL
jgi:hypothetical protein